MVVLVFEVAHNPRDLSRLFQWLRLTHSSRSQMLNDSMHPLLHGALGGM